MATLLQSPLGSREKAERGYLKDEEEGPKRILVVEDDPGVRLYIARALRVAGYVVTEAATGAQALWMAGEDTFDLVVCDLSLPDTTGPRLVKVLRDRSLPGVDVLYVSGHFQETVEESGLLPAGASFLGKPFKPEALWTAVSELVA